MPPSPSLRWRTKRSDATIGGDDERAMLACPTRTAQPSTRAPRLAPELRDPTLVYRRRWRIADCRHQLAPLLPSTKVRRARGRLDLAERWRLACALQIGAP